MCSFTDYKLSDEIQKALEGLDYKKPTSIQHEVIPYALSRNDLLVKSKTGSGKTAAYGIPICQMVDWIENKPQALVLTPTRELALQVKEDISNIGRLKRIRVTAIYGKEPIGKQKIELKQKNHVVVGTPGRIFDHIERGTLALDQIKFLVIDEADEMLNMGFIEQVEIIIKELPKDRATMLFSATLPEEVKNLAMKYMKKPIDIEMNPEGVSSKNIDHFLYETMEENKLPLLRNVTIMENPDSCIIFCQTKERVEIVKSHLNNLGYSCEKIHGGMEQKERFHVMDSFKKGMFRYLIATDVAARGIDVENISLIINYDIPSKKEVYVHRCGRTGRAGLTGKAITFVTAKERRIINDIDEYMGFSLQSKETPSQEEILERLDSFETKMKQKPEVKKAKGEELNKEIMKLRFTGGKDKKLRATNFVGMISNIEGITAEDIGIITILDSLTYVEILNGKGQIVLDAMEYTTMKGKNLKVTRS